MGVFHDQWKKAKAKASSGTQKLFNKNLAKALNEFEGDVTKLQNYIKGNQIAKKNVKDAEKLNSSLDIVAGRVVTIATEYLKIADMDKAKSDLVQALNQFISKAKSIPTAISKNLQLAKRNQY